MAVDAAEVSGIRVVRRDLLVAFRAGRRRRALQRVGLVAARACRVLGRAPARHCLLVMAGLAVLHALPVERVRRVAGGAGVMALEARGLITRRMELVMAGLAARRGLAGLLVGGVAVNTIKLL